MGDEEGRTHPAIEAFERSPLQAGVVDEEIVGAVAGVDEDEGPAWGLGAVSALGLL